MFQSTQAKYKDILSTSVLNIPLNAQFTATSPLASFYCVQAYCSRILVHLTAPDTMIPFYKPIVNL